MATHDYVIANGTGAAVRSDLNNALAAIVSNNSGSSEPGTTYAYQWWADTNANVLKIRNSSNDGWVTLRELDGTMLIEDGSASSPGLAFADDTNTGIFSPAADQIGFATGGAERLEIGSSEVVFNDPSNDVDFRVESDGNTHMLFVDAGNNGVGIGTSTVSNVLHVHQTDTSANSYVHITQADGGSGATDGLSIGIEDGGVNAVIRNRENGYLRMFTNDSERARIDSSGRLLHGTTSAANLNNASGASAREAKAYIFNNPGTTSERYSFALIGGGDFTSGPSLFLNKTRSTSVAHTVVEDGDELGQVRFQGSDGTHYVQAARIDAEVDGTPGTNDMPGRLKFLTTADGASSPSERVRIDSSGNLNLVSSGSTLTDLNFTASDLTVYARVEGGKSGSGVGDLRFHTYSGGLSEAMRIDSSGRVLIGTTAPAISSLNANLEVRHTSVPEFIFSRNDTSIADNNCLGRFRWYGNDDDGTYEEMARFGGHADGTHTSSSKPGKFLFGVAAPNATSPTDRFLIDSLGRIDQFASNDSAFDIHFAQTAASEIAFRVRKGATDLTDGTACMQILADGDIENTNNNYGAISDAKLKENIVDASSQWEDIKGLRIRNYNFKESTNYGTHTQIGVVAQEVEAVSPGLVSSNPDRDDDGNELGTVTKSVSYSVLYVKAVKALQEAMDRIETLEAKVAALEAG